MWTVTELARVTCPTCFEEFGLAAPSPDEVPCEFDYDCEVCCRPMLVLFSCAEGEVYAEARGLDE